MKLVILVLVLFVLAGCDVTTGPSTSITDVEVHTGRDGLRFGFLENAPPGQVFENEEFPVMIQMANKGAFDIENGYAKLLLEEDYMEFIEWDDYYGYEGVFFDLAGKSTDNIEGEQDIVQARIKAKELEPESETHTSAVKAQVCYDYETEFSDSVCVDSDPYDSLPVKKVCKVNDLTFSSGQGGTVAVTKIEPRMLVEGEYIKPTFLIYVENVGNGEVFEREKIMEACEGAGDYKKFFNTIYVEAFLGEDKLDCGINPIRLIEEDDVKEDFVKCGMTRGIRNKMTYSTVLTVRLEYGYTETVSREVEIRKT